MVKGSIWFSRTILFLSSHRVLFHKVDKRIRFSGLRDSLE